MKKVLDEIKMMATNNKKMFFFFFAILMIVYVPFYTGYLPNPDTLVYNNGGYYRGIHWELSLGRWGIMFFDTLFGGINSPILSSVVYFIAISLSTIFIIDIFGLNATKEKVLVGLLVLITPFNGNILTYYYCSYNYGFAFLFMILAIWIFYKNDSKWYVNLGCIFGVMLSFSLYQSYAGVGAVMAIGITVYRILICNEDVMKVMKKTIGFVVNAVIGGIMYICVLFLGLKVLHVEMADYKGANSISLSTIVGSLGSNFIKAYKEFVGYYFDHDYIGNHFGNHVLSIFVFVVCSGIVLAAIKNMKGWLRKILVIIGIVFIPVGANIIDFIVPGSFLSIQAASGNAICIPILVALCLGVMKGMPKNEMSKCAMMVMTLLISIYSWMNILQIETDAIALENANKSGMYALESVNQTIEEEIRERGEMQVAVIGNPEFGYYTISQDILELASKYAAEGVLWDYRRNAWYGWTKLLKEEFHATYSFLPVEEAVAISDSVQFEKMGIYPAADSIQVIDNVLVIKVSEMKKFKD